MIADDHDHDFESFVAKLFEYFKTERSELYNYIHDEVYMIYKKFKLVHAPVKSGKRGMIEIYSLLDRTCKHIFLSALHRKADEKQRLELKKFHIEVFSINNKNKKDNCITFIDNLLSKNEKVKVHLDELDFGCGDNQLLNTIWSKYKTNSNVYFILYSATTEVAKNEFLIANKIKDFHECKRFIPPSNYFGINSYLENNKFIQASPFISYDEKEELIITSQGEELISKLIENTKDTTHKRHIAILRLAGNFKINRTTVSQFEKMKVYKDFFEKKYNIRLKFVGSNDNTVEWDNYSHWEESYESKLPFIIVINQVSGRSTEWKCHPFIVWYHTLRTDDTPIGTIIQDQERPVYYKSTDNDNIDIEIYGDFPCAQYSAGIIKLPQMIAMTSRKLNSRLDAKTKKKHIIIDTDGQYYYDKWEDIPKEFTKGKSKSTYVNDDNILRPTMYIVEKNKGASVKKEYDIPNWDKYSHLEGFYMANVRSSRINFIKGKPKTKAIWFKSDIELELNEGINEKNKIRINLVYENGETDPNNYKFIVRRFKEAKEANFSNTTMYNM